MARKPSDKAEKRRQSSAGATRSSSLDAASAIATISAALVVIERALTCAPQAPAVPAIILGLLNHALNSYAVAHDQCRRSGRMSEDAHARGYHGSEN
jgi:hypothetical protein